MRTDQNKNVEHTFFYKDSSNMSHFLDVIIEQQSDLGKLGRELECLLRIAGVRSVTDPKLSNRYH